MFVFIGNKPWYIMPMYVPAAVLLGRVVDTAARGEEPELWSVALGAIVALTVSPAYSIAPGDGGRFHAGATIVVGTALVAWVHPLHERLATVLPRASPWITRLVPTVVALVVVVGMIGVPPAADGSAAQRSLADELDRHASTSALVFVQRDLGTPLHSFSFYAQRPLVSGPLRALDDGDARYAIVRTDSLNDVRSDSTALANVTSGDQSMSLIRVSR
jgi:hypothetical protein